MKYYVKSIVEYIVEQLNSVNSLQHGGKRLQLMISQLPAQTTFAFAHALEDICFAKHVSLVFKVAQELAWEWTQSEQSELNAKGYCASGSLTQLRNHLSDGETVTLQILIGSSRVTDKGSLADFHQCDADNIWAAGMKYSFDGWLEDFFETHGISYSVSDLRKCNDILKELAERFDIIKVSDFLEDLNPVSQTAVESIRELLRALNRFGLPDLSGFVSSPKNRSFQYYVESAYSFFGYEAFMDPGKRDKALKNLQAFIDGNQTDIEPEKIDGFESEDAFLDALDEYVKQNEKEYIQQLKKCDFIFIWDTILKFRPTKEPSDKQTLRKLSGTPVEVVLQALWFTLQKYKTATIREITLTGKTFKHDYFYEINQPSPDAQEALKRLLGGIDELLMEHIQLTPYVDADKIIITSALLNEEISYPSSKNGEPFFEFWITISGDSPSQEFHFAMKLPEIHSFRLADSLLVKANDGLNARTDWHFPLPIFHLAYYRELMAAKDEEEIGRILLHCINESRPNSTVFMENVFTKTWHERHEALGQYLEKISSKYHEFLLDACENGLHSALFHTAKPLVDSFHCATEAFITKDDCAKCQKLACMLMRSFLIIDQKKGNQDSWVVEPFEKNGIVTILHPAIIEMLQAQIVFLLTAFTNLVATELGPNGRRKFKVSQWQYYIDMAAIQMPLAGLLTDRDGKLNIDVRGKGLIHRIGDIDLKNTPMATRLLVRYDNVDDEEISDSEIFKESSESKLLLRILNDYRIVHPHAQDGITLAVYRNDDVQPVLSALNGFLKKLYDGKIIYAERQQKYAVSLILFSESADDTAVANWLEQWQERWEAAESEDKLKYYSLCQFSVAHRIVSREDDRKQFRKILDTELDCDIIAFYDFIEAGRSGNKFMPAHEFDSTQDTLKFPILEKAFCSNLDPDEILKRSQIISNRQFRVNSDHTEILAKIKNNNTALGERHVILGHGDFEPWQKVVEAAHNAAEWVVCIDANIDDKLIAQRGMPDASCRKRELIGFGSGVGIHGESNYTISTQKFFFDDLKRILKNSLKTIYKYGNPEEDLIITDCLMQNASSLSGLSLIRALGPSFYICDFMAYSLMHKILPLNQEQHLCDQIFSIDAYRHWFDMSSDDDKMHPDLLWLRADLTPDGEIVLDVKVIECKMQAENLAAIEKAQEQIQNGLDVLVKAFTPKQTGVEIPDQRYWHLQLHRLIASSAKASLVNEGLFLSAMEKLAAGNFSIKWSAGIFAFWTDNAKSTLDEIDRLEIDSNNEIFSVPVYAMGYKFIKNICAGQLSPIVNWGNDNVEFSAQNIDESPVDEREIVLGDDSSSDDNDIVIDNEETTLVTTAVDVSAISESAEQRQCLLSTSADAPPVQVTNSHIPARILLGMTIRGGRNVYWEFGHKQLNNRHMLIFGNSGMGKTYAIQGILCELGVQGQNSLIVDYTNGFVPNQLQTKTKEALQPAQHIVKNDKLPINPFKKQSQEIGDGLVITDSPTDVAKRIAATFKTVYQFGPHQFSLLTDALEEGINRFSENVSLDHVMDILQEFLEDGIHTRAQVMTVISKLKTFVSERPFSASANLGWNTLFSDAIRRCHIFQLTMIDRFSSSILTEFILWDLYSYVRSSGNEKYPKVVVLDEIQNLDHSLDAPVAKYLTEGRKFGISLIAATQTLSNLERDAQSRLFQSAHKLFFKPADPEVNQYADFVRQAAGNGDRNKWISELTSLQKGECLSIGPSLNENTGKLENQVFRIKIAALEDRGL